MTLEEAMLAVWRQALVEGKPEVDLDGRTFPVRETPKKRLREVDFEWRDPSAHGLASGRLSSSDSRFAETASGKGARDATITLRGLEQNPNTNSRWAQLARKGHRVMQFLDAGRYVGVVVDGKVVIYGRRT